MSKRTFPKKFLSAVIALPPLPGAPLCDDNDERIIEHVLDDLEKYTKVGADSIFLENDHDLPYIKPPLPREAISLTTTIAKEVRKRFHGPIGIQMLEAANETSLEIAAAAELDYIRVEGYVFAHVGGSGIIEGCAGRLLRLRKQLGCEQIKVFADVKKKHCAHALTADLDITDEIREAEFFLVDGVIVTSQFTGIEPKVDDLVKAKRTTELPILIGSGMTPDNIERYIKLADGFIVGSTFRKEGKFLEEIDEKRLKRFTDVFHKLRDDLV